MKRKRIAVDMDEVMAQVVPKFLDLYEDRFGRRLERDAYWGRKIYQIDGALEIRDALHVKGFFADLPVMPGSREVLEELHRGYEIYIVSAAMEFRTSLEDKHAWLERHFPFIHWKNMVFCGDKSIIDADYMIDDHPHNLETFRGTGLLFTASHNVDESRFTRVDDWWQVRDFFRETAKRDR